MTISTDPYKREEVSVTGTDYRLMMYKEFPSEALMITKKYDGNAPLEVFVEAYSRLHKDRVLDKMPVPLRQKQTTGLPSGVKEIFKVHYTSVKVSDKEETTGVFIGPNGAQVTCDIQIMKVLKALFMSHVTKNEQAHRAIMSVLPLVLRATTGSEYLTVKRLLALVEDQLTVTKAYYEKQILLGIQEVLDESRNQVAE